MGDEIFLVAEEAKLGSLDASSMKTGQEWGVITALGPDVQNKDLKVGTKIFVKAWSLDIILYEGQNYLFTTESRKGIKAIIQWIHYLLWKEQKGFCNVR